MRHIAVIGQFALFIIVIFIVGQAAVIPLFDTYEQRPESNLTDPQGDVILDGGNFMDNMQNVLFKWLPAMMMVGIPLIAFLFYIRFSRLRGPGP